MSTAIMDSERSEKTAPIHPSPLRRSDTSGPRPTAGSSQTVIGSIYDQMRDTPGKLALATYPGGEILTYGGLRHASLRFARLLREARVAEGDIVMLFLPTRLDAYAAFVGAMMVGAVPTFMPCPSPKQDPAHYWRDHRALIMRTRPRAILADNKTADDIASSGLTDEHAVTLLRLDDATVELEERLVAPACSDGVALLQHSSGTTGLKKGVMLTHAAIVEQVGAYSAAIGATRDDVVATWLPVYHDMGLITSTLMPLMLGQTVVVMDPFLWSARPGLLLEAIETYRATLVWQPNFAFEHLVRTVQVTGGKRIDLSSVRCFVNCSEPCRTASFDRFAAHFAPWGAHPGQLQVCYAMAETVFAVSQTDPGMPPGRLTMSTAALREEGRCRPVAGAEPSLTLLSNGKPIAGMHVCARREDGTLCADREVGELLVRGGSVFSGYFRLPEQTADRLTESGYRTRDLGFVADGEVYVLGRLDDVIVVHGRNYYAGEVEASVSRVPDVRPGRAVAFGVDNADAGSQDVVVVAESDIAVEDRPALSRRIKRAVLQEIGLGLREARIVPAGWLNKTTSGKVSRERNRARHLAERADPSSV